MSKESIPTIGKPVFTLAVLPWNKKIKITNQFGGLNSLSYVAVNATKCMSVGYTDDTMTQIIINKGFKDDKGNDVSITIPAEDSGRKRTSVDCFVNEAEANAIAMEMNKQFKDEVGAILDVVTQIFHEYDNLYAALKNAK